MCVNGENFVSMITWPTDHFVPQQGLGPVIKQRVRLTKEASFDRREMSSCRVRRMRFMSPAAIHIRIDWRTRESRGREGSIDRIWESRDGKKEGVPG